MKRWKVYWMALVVSAGLVPAVRAQFPGAAPPAPSPLGAPIAPPPTAPAAAPQGNLWSFFCMTPEQKLACKLCFCNSPFGKIFTSMLQPVSVFSGGLFGSCCPNAQLAADLMQPADSPGGAAARIKADEAAAAARRADVRYLGTVDCRRWPEAEEALIGALRADRNECVRLEAAWALNRGCCCTRKTIEALALTVSGSERDGNPPERSERVRAAAEASLNHCLAGLSEAALEAPPPAAEPVPPPKEGPKEGSRLPDVSSKYYQKIEKQPVKKVVEDARRALAQAHPATQTAAARRPTGGLVEIVTRAFKSGEGEAPVQVAASQPPATPEPPALKPGPQTDVVTRPVPQPPQPAPVRTVGFTSASPYAGTAATPLAADSRQGRCKEAEAACREAIQLPPVSPNAQHNPGSAPYQQGRFKEAEAACRAALRLQPNSPEAHNNLGVALGAQQRFKEAEAAYRAAIRLKPDYPQAHNNLGVALGRQGRFKEAEAACREAIRLKPDYREAHNNLGLALEQQGRFKEAEAAHREAIRLKPGLPEAHNNLGPSQPRAVTSPGQAPAKLTAAAWGSTLPAPAPHAEGPLPVEAHRLMAILQYGATAEERQAAAEGLAASAWSSDGRVTGALSACGHEDPSPAVRATCLRCLSRISFDRLSP